MKNILMRYGVLFSATLVFSDVFAQSQPYPGHHGLMGDWGWGGMILGPVFMLVFLGVAVAVVVFVIRWMGGSNATPNSPGSTGKPALDILQERYARGEIDTDEFETRKRVLSE